MDISLEQKITNKFRLLIILSIISVLVSIFSLVSIARINLILTFDRQEHRARELVERVVYSINQHRDYYKNYCNQNAIADINENISKITANYEIILLETELGHYEFDLIFDGENKFSVYVEQGSNGSLKVTNFSPLLK